MAASAAGVSGLSLDELNDLAELQTRVDRKYFVPADVFRRLIAELGDEMKVLHIDGRRSFGYESVYFDTPQLTTYKAHVQRRRQRFKARTRTYLDSGLCMFEVKLVGARGETVKERIKHPAEMRNVLTPDALRHLHTALRQAYGHGLPAGMAPVLTTTYRRTTFVSRTGEVRLTCDVGLLCRNGRNQVRDTGTHVLVESKTAGQDGGARRDPAHPRHPRGVGEQVLRRHRRAAPRAAVQQLAPDPAALLRAAHAGRLRAGPAAALGERTAR